MARSAASYGEAVLHGAKRRFIYHIFPLRLDRRSIVASRQYEALSLHEYGRCCGCRVGDLPEVVTLMESAALTKEILEKNADANAE